MSEKSKEYKTPQEAFWAGRFGDEYSQRNTAETYLSSNIALFSKILATTGPVGSVVEFGANIGLNLRALNLLLPVAQMNAVEINKEACAALARSLPHAKIHQTSILEVELPVQFDLALIKGVLIHINPDALSTVYAKLAAASAKYVMIAEYYSPVPVMVEYRGESDRLFKRDFAGEFLDAHPDFSLVDYGFGWRRDPVFPQDDITWFLLERQGDGAHRPTNV